MGVVPECSLVVKRTFLEFVTSPRAEGRRPRCFSDTGLVLSAPSLASDLAYPFPAKPLVAEALPSAPAWPGTPMLDAAREPDLGPVDLEATAEVKAVLGMGPHTGPSTENSASERQWLMPVATWPEGFSHQQMLHQQQYVFVPLADSTQDCRMAVACWPSQGGLWTLPPSPSTSSTADVLSDAPCSSEGSSALQAGETRTTVMLRTLPAALTRNVLIQVLSKMGFTGCFDLVYIPVNFSTGENLGYAFVNLVSPANVPALWRALDGFSGWGVPSDMACTVCWSEPNQGLLSHIERYRNSPVMHPAVPDEWKPALFMNGIRSEFPAPTKKIKAPKMRGGNKAETA